MRILGFDIIRAKPGEGIILSQDALAKLAVDQGGNIRIPQASTAGGAGFDEPVIYNVDRGSGKRLRVHHTRVIHVQTRPTRARKRLSTLKKSIS